MYNQKEGWESSLRMDGRGTPRACSFNALLALRSAREWQGVLRFDNFRGEIIMSSPAPWVRSNSPFEPRAWSEHDDALAQEWLQEKSIYLGIADTQRAVDTVSRENSFDSLVEHVESLQWDNKPRLDGWLTRFLGAPDNPYTNEIGRKWLIGAVARALQPGCKFDNMLILEGEQGLKKSTALAVIGGEYFTDSLSDIGTKDAAIALDGRWIVELAELDGMNRRDAGTVKAFLSKTEDKYRPPYARREVVRPRRIAFAGSVNVEGGYLSDSTGGRRFWPISCSAVVGDHLDTDGLAAVRDQLIAEAKAAFLSGEIWHLSGELEAEAMEEQELRRDRDPWSENVLAFLSDKSSATVTDLLTGVVGKDLGHCTRADSKRIGGILTAAGWSKRRRRDSSGQPLWVWVKPGTDAEAA